MFVFDIRSQEYALAILKQFHERGINVHQIGDEEWSYFVRLYCQRRLATTDVCIRFEKDTLAVVHILLSILQLA